MNSPHGSRTRGAALRVGDDTLECSDKVPILTLSHAESSAQDQPPARNWRRGLERAGPILLIVLLVVLWQILTRAFEIPNFLLPAPTDIARLIVDEWPLIQMHSIATISSIISGYITAVLFALAVSALMIRFPLAERLIMPIFVGLQSVPKIAIAPLILVWVGAGIGSKIAVVASIAFFPIVINTMAGFKEMDRGLADVFRSVDASERQMFFRLRLPYAMPYIFAGLRIATTLAVLGAIVAEWLAASNGLGYLVLSGSFNFNTALVRGDHRARGGRHDLLQFDVVDRAAAVMET